MTAHLTKEQRALAHRLRREGHSLRSIARDIGLRSPGGVTLVLSGQRREGREDVWRPREGRLSLEEREEISLGLRAGESMRSIACRLGRARRQSPERSSTTVDEATIASGTPTCERERRRAAPRDSS